MTYASSTHPESLHKILARSLKLYRVSLHHAFILALAVALIVFSPRLIVLIAGKNIFATMPPFSPYKFVLFLVDLLSLIFLTAMLWRIQCIILHKHESIKDDMKIAVRKLPLILGAAIIQAVILTVILVPTFYFYAYLQMHGLFFQKNPIEIFLIALPLIIAVTLYAYIFYLVYFYLPLILTENDRILFALKESLRLVWGNWWKVFLAQITPWLCYVIVLMLIKYIAKVDIHIFLAQAKTITYIPTLIQIVIFALFIPWSAAMMLVQLRDLELRKKLNHEKSS